MLKSVQDSKKAILVVFSATIFFFLESVLQNLFGTLSHEMMSAFHINAYQLGKLSAAYLFATILFLFPAGMILDRVSIRKVLVIAIACCALTAWVFYHTTNAYTATICMFISGIGGTFCFLGTMKLASRWFTGKNLAVVTGLVVTSAMMGGFVAQTPIAILTHHFGWRSAFLFIMFAEAALCLWVAAMVKDFPEKFKDHKKAQGLKSIKNSIVVAFTTKTNWLGGLFTSALNLPVTVMGAIWGVPFLMQAHHFNRTTATSINALIFIGMMIGPPCAGWLSDKVKSRTTPMFAGTLISMLLITLIIFSNFQTYFMYAFLFLSLGFFSSVQILGYTIIVEHSKSEYTGASLSVAAVLVMSGGTFMQPLFGKIMQWHWTGTMHNGAPTYSLHAYQDALLILPIALVIALGLIVMLKKTQAASQIFTYTK